MLELYDRDGELMASVPATRDDRDKTKWILGGHVVIGDGGVESALIRLDNGKTLKVPPTVFPTSVPINVLFLTPDA